jgi:hypothetical protein
MKSRSLVVVLLTLTFTGILFTTHRAHAFTLFPSEIIYDPISVGQNQSVHLHAMNNMGSTPYGVIINCKPTESWLGSPSGQTVTTLNPGDGMDATINFSAFSPTPGTTRLPVVCTLGVVGIPATQPLEDDWSGRLVSSVEIVDDLTNKQVEILGSRHILTSTKQNQPPTFCLFCD